MIENNRNHINVQSYGAAGYSTGLSEMITDFRAVWSEDKHYGNDPHYARDQIIDYRIISLL